MRLTLLLFFTTALCLARPLFAADKPLVVDLWPGKVPDAVANAGEEKSLMSQRLTSKQVEVTEPTRMVTNVSKPTITICRPPKDKDTGAAMLICPGGGYWNLYWQLEGEEVAAWLNSQGITGIILKYRVPRQPDEVKTEPARRPLLDAQRAVSLVRSKAGEWAIDPKRIGIIGFSAGGHLALATATRFEKRAYPAIDAIDEVSCRPDFAILCYPGYLKAPDKEELAPWLHIPAGTPPIFLAHGGDDIISSPEQSVVAYLALKRAGIPAELHIYATAAHDFGVRASDHPCSTWTVSCIAWLRHQGLLEPNTTVLSPSISATEGQPPASPEVTAAMQPYLDSYKLAGVIAIIADKSGKIHYRNLLGYADVEAKKPISEDNVFWIASMSKMFVGASIMTLVDEGKVSLDDPVTKFIPQLNNWMVVAEKDQTHVLLKPLVRPVTIRHLLSHTSGLTGGSELQHVTGADSTPLKARALSSVTGPLQWQPGDKYAYGNQGMNIAARVVEIVSGMSYEDFLQKRFFDPLDMKETTFWPTEAQVARLAGAYGPNKEKNGYARGGLGYLTKPLSDRVHRFPEAAGGLFSTTHDIFRYGLMLANDGELDGRRYLSHAAMDELRKEQTGSTKVNYSLGYHLRNGMFGHDGAYGTDLSVNPKTGMVAIFMVQCSGGDQWAARDLFLKTATRVFPK